MIRGRESLSQLGVERADPARRLKASIHNPRVHDDTKVELRQRLKEMGLADDEIPQAETAAEEE